MIWKTTTTLAEQSYKAGAAYVRENELALILTGDGAWSHRRSANQGVYSILDANTQKIVYQVRQALTPCSTSDFL